jgi:hypothetical protein
MLLFLEDFETGEKWAPKGLRPLKFKFGHCDLRFAVQNPSFVVVLVLIALRIRVQVVRN